MAIYSIFAIENDGKFIISDSFDNEKSLLKKIEKSELILLLEKLSVLFRKTGIPNIISFATSALHWKSFGDFQVIVESDSDTRPKDLLIMVGWEFSKIFQGEKAKLNNHQLLHESLKVSLSQQIDNFEKRSSTDFTPDCNLSSYEMLVSEIIYKLPSMVKPLANVLKRKGPCSLQELESLVDCSKIDLIDGLEYLKNKGILKIDFIQGRTIFRISVRNQDK